MKSGNKISFKILSLEVIILMIDMNMLFDQITMTLKNHMFDMYSNRFLKMQVINFFLIMFFFMFINILGISLILCMPQHLLALFCVPWCFLSATQWPCHPPKSSWVSPYDLKEKSWCPPMSTSWRGLLFLVSIDNKL